jgi:hypothetical protein
LSFVLKKLSKFRCKSPEFKPQHHQKKKKNHPKQLSSEMHPIPLNGLENIIKELIFLGKGTDGLNENLSAQVSE